MCAGKVRSVTGMVMNRFFHVDSHGEYLFFLKKVVA